MRYRQPDTGRRRRAAGPLRLRLRALWAKLSQPVARWRNARRARRGRRELEPEPSWRHSSPMVIWARIATGVIAVVFGAWVARAVLVVIRNDPRRVPLNFEQACQNTDLSCDAISGSLTPILSIVLASAVFLFYRLWQVHRPYLRRARERPQELVETAGKIIGQVVGRDELCRVMIRDLHDRDTRRPHVVVGGVGTGKTALLVKLTELLARRGAVPVPVRLRDAQDQLDFRELARRRFLVDADAMLLSDAEGEKVWRRLARDDRIVVLADGLEEALLEGDAGKERDNRIRLALRRANHDGLPLVVASRPHDPLRGMEAAIVELEPLSEEAALDYVQPVGSSAEEQRLDWIVETADVAETPLYLQITRQLHRAGRLAYVAADGEEGEWFDIRSVDRAALRSRLLHAYVRALVGGHFPAGVPLTRDDRVATVEQLSALACIGLKKDRLQVGFGELEPPARPPATEGTAGALPARVVSLVRTRLRVPPARPDPAAPAHAAIVAELERRLGRVGRPFDVRLAATWGAQLGLVEATGDGVRFPHSIMQAYLGSRFMDAAMSEERYRREALESPGRELLIALVLHSREQRLRAGPPEAVPARRPTGVRARRPTGNRAHHLDLWQAAGQRHDVKALDLYAAALEIDSILDHPSHEQIAAELRESWPKVSARDPRTLEEAKLNLVRRFGDAARQIGQRQAELGSTVRPAYLELYRISCSEPSYPVRLAAAQEIGSGGDQAFDALEGELGPPAGETAGPGDDRDEELVWRQYVTRAWLAPLLAGSTRNRRSAAQGQLRPWLALAEAGSRREDARFRLSYEVALAQGFKFAANRRRDHPQANAATRSYLAQQAREMLRSSEFWFSRLTLLHALSLWALPDPVGGARPGRGRADPMEIVASWMDTPDGRPEHPFVDEARTLTVWALETGQPERYVWIDESGVVSRIGSRPARPDVRRKHNLWIPPSTGWTALHPRALRLVADVLLLLNLAERGGPPGERDRRLQQTNRPYLPPCLAGKRDPLDPMRSAGASERSEPGSNCTVRCPFRLCPYPPRSEGSYRVELSEALCRRQQTLVREGWARRRAAPWQETLPRDLTRFWKEMGQRAHTSEVELEPRTGRPHGRAGRRR